MTRSLEWSGVSALQTHFYVMVRLLTFQHISTLSLLHSLFLKLFELHLFVGENVRIELRKVVIYRLCRANNTLGLT